MISKSSSCITTLRMLSLSIDSFFRLAPPLGFRTSFLLRDAFESFCCPPVRDVPHYRVFQCATTWTINSNTTIEDFLDKQNIQGYCYTKLYNKGQK
ncbi:hypothetical protein XELAEV_18004745mg [Xenopus laevis]|uniref:Uncharacterized protein n=1 Tax=Xenopus laevis TaxID=8355 RepID=A0A974BPK0_XENLA|nr:hypothetical protein XELAEV_18004745mg [Xenopus laevis]